MFLYDPKTNEQKEGLILVYQMIIDKPSNGFINLLLSNDHFRWHFISRHEEQPWWQWFLNWSDDPRITDTRTGRMLIFGVALSAFTYFGMCWAYYALRLLINFKKIRHEAPLNLLKLG